MIVVSKIQSVCSGEEYLQMDCTFHRKTSHFGIQAWAEFAVGGVLVRLKLVSKQGRKKEVMPVLLKY